MTKKFEMIYIQTKNTKNETVALVSFDRINAFSSTNGTCEIWLADLGEPVFFDGNLEIMVLENPDGWVKFNDEFGQFIYFRKSSISSAVANGEHRSVLYFDGWDEGLPVFDAIEHVGAILNQNNNILEN